MFRRAIAFVACVGLLISGVSAAGFSAQLVQSSGAAPLQNGANSVNIGSGTWTTTALAGFNDGQFQTDGGYIIPVGGVYHFDAVIQVEVTATTSPNQQADLRIVRCANGCNALCNGGTDVAETLIQAGNYYFSDSFNGAFPPTFSLSASFTGLFNTGDLIALCVDNKATSGSLKIVCPAKTCAFSGFAA